MTILEVLFLVMLAITIVGCLVWAFILLRLLLLKREERQDLIREWRHADLVDEETERFSKGAPPTKVVVQTPIPVELRLDQDAVWVATSPMVKGLLVVSKDYDKLVKVLVPQALVDLAKGAIQAELDRGATP